MRLIIVSNRLPITIKKEGSNLSFKSSVGGLVTGLADYLEHKIKSSGKKEYLWVGWPGATIDKNHQKKAQETLLKNFQSVPVFLPESQMDKFYYGFCNKTLWPLFHYYPMLTSFDEKFWQSYQSINEVFMRTLVDIIQPDDTIWIHDYHLLLLPGMIRKKFPMVKIGFFLHIPFPSYEVFRLLPKKWRERILSDLLGADLIGFHTHEYTQYFLHCVQRLLGLEHNMGNLLVGHRMVKADTFPMGINFTKFNEAGKIKEVANETEALKKSLKGLKAVLSIDRLDYTKGIINRLLGYEKFLENHPEWNNKVTLLLIIVPSRTGIDHYLQIKRQVDEIVGKINGKFGKVGWSPILYQYNSFDFKKLVAFFRASDVALVTPLRDGMNLVAKEYLASRDDKKGVLILSEMAGAAKELGEAVVINPNNTEEISEALVFALNMEEEEQINRNTVMQKRLLNCNVIYWAEDFLQKLQQTCEASSQISLNLFAEGDHYKLLTDFKTAKNRLILLDYDGTLSPLVRHPSLAKPSSDTVALINDLCNVPNVDLAIVSGRSKEILEKWFPIKQLHLVAEHGVWMKHPNEDWKLQKEMSNTWKSQIISILEMYANRVPGSFVEEKEYSLCWHYRNADIEIAKTKSKELWDDLISFTANQEIQVLQGSRVIEIRNTGINKGTAVATLLKVKNYEFVVGIGDDLTDEDLFKALPEQSYTIKVGGGSSCAKYNIDNCGAVIELLRSMLK